MALMTSVVSRCAHALPVRTRFVVSEVLEYSSGTNWVAHGASLVDNHGTVFPGTLRASCSSLAKTGGDGKANLGDAEVVVVVAPGVLSMSDGTLSLKLRASEGVDVEWEALRSQTGEGLVLLLAMVPSSFNHLMAGHNCASSGCPGAESPHVHYRPAGDTCAFVVACEDEVGMGAGSDGAAFLEAFLSALSQTPGQPVAALFQGAVARSSCRGVRLVVHAPEPPSAAAAAAVEAALATVKAPPRPRNYTEPVEYGLLVEMVLQDQDQDQEAGPGTARGDDCEGGVSGAGVLLTSFEDKPGLGKRVMARWLASDPIVGACMGGRVMHACVGADADAARVMEVQHRVGRALLAVAGQHGQVAAWDEAWAGHRHVRATTGWFAAVCTAASVARCLVVLEHVPPRWLPAFAGLWVQATSACVVVTLPVGARAPAECGLAELALDTLGLQRAAQLLASSATSRAMATGSQRVSRRTSRRGSDDLGGLLCPTDPEVVRLVRLVDGHPLVLTLIGGHLRKKDAGAVSATADALERAMGVAKGGAVGAVAVGARVQAALDVVLGGLGVSHQGALRTLGVLEPGTAVPREWLLDTHEYWCEAADVASTVVRDLINGGVVQVTVPGAATGAVLGEATGICVSLHRLVLAYVRTSLEEEEALWDGAVTERQRSGSRFRRRKAKAEKRPWVRVWSAWADCEAVDPRLLCEAIGRQNQVAVMADFLANKKSRFARGGHALRRSGLCRDMWRGACGWGTGDCVRHMLGAWVGDLSDEDCASGIREAFARGNEEALFVVAAEMPELTRAVSDTASGVYACACHGLEAVTQLLIKVVGANAERAAVCGETPILGALREGHVAVVGMLAACISGGALGTAMATLVEAGDLGGVRVLAPLVAAVDDAWVLAAAERGHWDILQVLVDHGGNVDARRGHLTPLLAAVKEGNRRRVDALAAVGARLEIAVRGDWAEVADRLSDGCCPMLRGLDLQSNDLGVPANDLGGTRLEEVARVLAMGCCPDLRRVDLSANDMRDAGAAVVAGLLRGGHLGALECLRLRFNRIRGDGIGAIMEAVSGGHCPQLRELVLTDNYMAEAGSEAVAAAMQAGRLSQLEALDVHNNFVGEAGLRLLMTAARAGGVPRLHSLRLGANELGRAGARVLAEAMSAGALGSLRVLDVASNGMGELGTQAVMEALGGGCCPKLESLDLGRNGMGESGALALADALRTQQCPHLHTILLEDNALGDAGTQALAEVVGTGRCPQLRRWCLRFNGLSSSGAAAVAKALGTGNCGRLAHLILGSNNIRADGAQSLAHVLGTACCPELAELCLDGNPIGDTGVTAMLQALAANACPVLRVLNLAQTEMGKSSARTLARALVQGAAPLLESLCLRQNPLREGGARALADALSAGGVPRLTNLDLGASDIRPGGARAIAEAMGGGAVPHLRSLDLGASGIGSQGAQALGEKLARDACPALAVLELEDNGVEPEILQWLRASLPHVSVRAY